MVPSYMKDVCGVFSCETPIEDIRKVITNVGVYDGKGPLLHY